MFNRKIHSDVQVAEEAAKYHFDQLDLTSLRGLDVTPEAFYKLQQLPSGMWQVWGRLKKSDINKDYLVYKICPSQFSRWIAYDLKFSCYDDAVTFVKTKAKEQEEAAIEQARQDGLPVFNFDASGNLIEYKG
jgi:hypothetical protein